MKYKIIHLLVGITVLGVLAAIFLQQNKYTKCGRACIREDYSKGVCVHRTANKNFGARCEELGAVFVNAHCPNVSVSGLRGAQEAGGVICCCE